MSSRNGTLSADTAAAVAVEGQRIEVLNRDGADEIWVRIDGSAPTVASTDADVFCIPAIAGAFRVFHKDRTPQQGRDSADHTVRLISAGTPTYSVTVL